MPKIFDVELVFGQIPKILQYLPVTLEISFVSMLLGLLLALLLAVIRINRTPVLDALVQLFVSFTRGTPLLIQLYIAYYGLPILLRYINAYYLTSYSVNNIPPIVFVIVAFTLNEAAYNSETLRAALQSVDKGQIEAGISLGMTQFQVLRRIVIPEAFEVALPNLGNAFISLIKGTSLAFVCAVVEMTAQGKILAGNNYRYFEAFLSLAIIYWLITVLIERIVAWLERRLSILNRIPADAAEEDEDRA